MQAAMVYLLWLGELNLWLEEGGSGLFLSFFTLSMQ
jgi:hypothetical protein